MFGRYALDNCLPQACVLCRVRQHKSVVGFQGGIRNTPWHLLPTLHAQGKKEYLTIEEPKVSINIPAIKAANLGAGALADLGLRWEVKTNFFIEPTNGTVTSARTAKA